MKSRTFSSFSPSGTSRCAGAGREYSQAASPGWPMATFHTLGIRLRLWMGIGQGAGICFSRFSELFLVQKFKLFQDFHKIHSFLVPWSLLGDWLRIGAWVVRIIVLYIVWFAYSWLSLLVSLLVLVVVLVFALLSY